MVAAWSNWLQEICDRGHDVIVGGKDRGVEGSSLTQSRDDADPNQRRVHFVIGIERPLMLFPGSSDPAQT